MARPPFGSKRSGDERARAEAAFKAATTRPVPMASRPAAAIPAAREQVTLRIDSAVLERFQADGPGWQDRINEALRKAVGLGAQDEGLPVDQLNAENDG